MVQWLWRRISLETSPHRQMSQLVHVVDCASSSAVILKIWNRYIACSFTPTRQEMCLCGSYFAVYIVCDHISCWNQRITFTPFITNLGLSIHIPVSIPLLYYNIVSIFYILISFNALNSIGLLSIIISIESSIQVRTHKIKIQWQIRNIKLKYIFNFLVCKIRYLTWSISPEASESH